MIDKNLTKEDLYIIWEQMAKDLDQERTVAARASWKANRLQHQMEQMEQAMRRTCALCDNSCFHNFTACLHCRDGSKWRLSREVSLLAR